MKLSFRILLVEDEPADRKLVETYLKGSLGIEFQLECAGSVGAAFEKLDTWDAEIILLDLSLPDSKGLEGLDRFIGAGTPVVILTGSEDHALALEALRMGAQDYLLKDELSPGRLVRCVLFAAERHRQVRSVRREGREDKRLAELGETPLPATASYHGVLPLSESAPETVAKLQQEYQNILAGVVDDSVFETKRDRRAELSRLASELGYLRASPRDVISFHTRTLSKLEESSGVNRAYREEGRFLLLEIMGHLVTYYRAFSTGAVRVGEQT